MQAGKLRQRVAIQHHVEARDDGGGVVESWQTLDTRWADVTPLTGRELLVAQAIDARLTHKVTLRFLPTLTAAQRFLVNGRVLNILTPPQNTGERNIETTCLCMEHV